MAAEIKIKTKVDDRIRLHVISDLHLDFGSFEVPIVDADIAIIAGDLANRPITAYEWLVAYHSKYPTRPIVLVLGNHDYYGSCFLTTLEWWNSKQLVRDKSIYLLQNTTIVLAIKPACHLAIAGCTYWTDFDRSSWNMLHAKQSIADFRAIRKPGTTTKNIEPTDVISEHDFSRWWLLGKVSSEWEQQQMQYHDSWKKTDIKTEPPRFERLIVTHHLPTYSSIAPQYEGSALNSAFASKSDDVVQMLSPAVWIHGHTHESLDYHLRFTRIICNPRGYGNENSHGFKASYVVLL